MSAMGAKACQSVRGIDPADCGHRIVAGAYYFWDGDRSYCSPACVERAKLEEEMETSDVPFLLDGLDVDSIKTLHELVERGRRTFPDAVRLLEEGRDFMLTERCGSSAEQEACKSEYDAAISELR